MKMKTKAKTLLAIALCAVALSACNTMEGAGQDIKQGGQSLENTARENK